MAAASLVLSAPSLGAVNVCPTVETAPVHSSGDAADDSAIWIHPTDPSLSTVIGTDKSTTGGLNVYDLAGTELQFRPDGRLNNVDVRYNFPLGASRVSLVGATNRVTRKLDFYKVNEADRSLTPIGSFSVGAPIATPRGISLYHSPVSGKYYAFVTDSGKSEQYELNGSSGVVTGTLVRTLANFTSATEGLVTDDELARLYVAQEDVGGVWRLGAEPGDPTSGTRIVATTENGGPIVQDVKGIAIYYASGGRGYLLATSQGGNSFHVLERGDNSYIGEFQIAACNGIDAVTGEDGIDVTNFPLDSRFPNGVFVSQDHANSGGTNQNHKLVPWESIANAFNPPLIIDRLFDPRTIGAPAAQGYPRPQAGRILRVPLAIAYRRCDSPDAHHGPGLAGRSCRAPVQSSANLTVGTLDANGQQTKSIGSVRMEVAGETPIDPSNGDQADVGLGVSMTDVRTAGALTDYTGEVGVALTLRITDRHNGDTPETAAATVQDLPYSFPVTCQPTTDESVGSTCAVTTTIDNLSPGTVVEGKRGNWALGPVRVTDGGPDGVVSTPGNDLFATQGIFVP